MSVRVMTAVWALALPDSEKIVLLALADCANDEGHCWPGMASLVQKCSKSDRTIQAAIKALCEAGHLTRREVAGKGCNYTVHPRNNFTPEAASPRKDCATPPKPVRDTPEAASGKPSKNHQKPSFLKGVGLPEGFPVEPYMALVKARLSLRPKVHFTEDAARGIVRKCQKLESEGYDIEKLLWKAVDQGWRTVFPNDDCKATSLKGASLSPEQLEERARFFESVGKTDEANDCRRRAKERRLAA